METIHYRQALASDIPQIQFVRHAVKENTLSDPSLVPDSDVEDYINNRGRGWVAEEEGRILGFSIVSVKDNNVWALFLLPEEEGKGIGQKLQELMMDWYFSQTDRDVWLSTSPCTRAASFYRKAGWRETGIYGKGEIKMEMTKGEWEQGKALS